MVELYHRDLGGKGQGRPRIIILHGLLGSSRNWTSAGRELAEHFEVTALDLRNHGDSPHAPTTELDDMVDDVLGWLDGEGLDAVLLMGHSLGGKVAMRIACRHPRRVRVPIVLDIAPRPYPPGSVELDAMHAVDLDAAASRRDVDEQLARFVDEAPTRAFLLTNLVTDGDGKLRWKVGLEGLRASIGSLRDAPLTEDDRYEGDTLFIVGGRSAYFVAADHAVVARHFPAVTIEVLDGSGHNVHFDARQQFVECVVRYLTERDLT